MRFDTIVIGAGLSGLTATSLLAKRGKKVLIVEKQFKSGGSCGIFKRNDVIFDQGSTIFFGFGETGFNPHRFVFNCLEEPINIHKTRSALAQSFIKVSCTHLMVENPIYATPDQTDSKAASVQFRKHPGTYLNFSVSCS